MIDIDVGCLLRVIDRLSPDIIHSLTEDVDDIPPAGIAPSSCPPAIPAPPPTLPPASASIVAEKLDIGLLVTFDFSRGR